VVVYLCVISNFVILNLNTNGYRVSFLGLGLSLFNRSNTMGVACGAGTEYNSERPEYVSRLYYGFNQATILNKQRNVYSQ
jgi:hypothetical protein